VGRVEKNLYWVTDGAYQAAFLTTRDGVVLFDAPPSIGHNLQRAIDQIAATTTPTTSAARRCSGSTWCGSGGSRPSSCWPGDGKGWPEPAQARLSAEDRFCSAPVARITRIR
jgi:hypothetical protein